MNVLPRGSWIHLMIFIAVMPAVHDVGGADLNLLRVLGALLDERHLTRAGKRLNLTQSATSHALARLRRLFDDALFVRTARGLSPTPRALELEEPVREALLAFERCFRGKEPFEPARAARKFSLASSDYGSFVLAPKLVSRLREEAPAVDLWLRALRSPFEEQLARGEVDVVTVPTRRSDLPAGIRSRPLYRERFVCLLRQSHPAVKNGRVALANWTKMRHVFIAPDGTPGGAVDEALARVGERRRVAVAVPHFLLAPHLVVDSDLVLTVGARVAEAFARHLPVQVVAPPIKLPDYELRMYWHERNHRDPAHQWFREAIRSAACH